MRTASRPSRRGIELKPATIRKRHNIAFRVNDALRAKLQKDADAFQRSVSEQIEYKLQLADDLSAILDAAKDPLTRKLFRVLFRSLKKARAISKNRGLSEAETRSALRNAFDHIKHRGFWTGEDEKKPEGCTDSDKPPARTADMSPAAMGYAVAEWAMFWDDDEDDLFREEELGQMSNVWSGDGKELVKIREPQPVKPLLSEILLGDNRELTNAPFVGSEGGDQS